MVSQSSFPWQDVPDLLLWSILFGCTQWKLGGGSVVVLICDIRLNNMPTAMLNALGKSFQAIWMKGENIFFYKTSPQQAELAIELLEQTKSHKLYIEVLQYRVLYGGLQLLVCIFILEHVGPYLVSFPAGRLQNLKKNLIFFTPIVHIKPAIATASSFFIMIMANHGEKKIQKKYSFHIGRLVFHCFLYKGKESWRRRVLGNTT